MKVLVACEYSGTVRDAFLRAGHYAASCDLLPTKDVKAEMMLLPKRDRERLHYLPPSPDRWKIRSTTFKGIADAMASQWGNNQG